MVRVRGDDPDELDDVEEEVEKPGFNSAYLDIFLESGTLSWTNWSENELSFWIFEEERIVVPPWADEPDLEEYRQGSLKDLRGTWRSWTRCRSLSEERCAHTWSIIQNAFS